MGRKGTEIAQENDVKGLSLISRFGWIRPQELAFFLWPESQHRVKNAERLAVRWVKSGLCLAREIPLGSGRALVLSAKGVQFLADFGIDARTGKDIGKVPPRTKKEAAEAEASPKKESNRAETISTKGWIPPTTWRHDLRAAGVLARLHAKGFQVWPEHQLRVENAGIKKIPDGLAVDSNGVGYWIEIERAHKSGSELDHLVAAIESVSAGRAPALSGVRCSVPVVVVDPWQLDSRGYSIDHQHRVTQAIKARVEHDVTLVFIVLELAGEGVRGYEKQVVRIEADSISRRVKMLRSGWEARGDTRTCLVPGRELVIEKQGASWRWYAYDTSDPRPDHMRTTRRDPVLIAEGVAETSEEAQRCCAAHWTLEEKPRKA